MSERVLIIGGGVAGIAAAAHLSHAGFHTTLIERRASLGGRAGSFPDADFGGPIDNCQHVLLGCCRELRHLFDILNIAHRLRFFSEIEFLGAGGRSGYLSAGWLPSPFHLAPSFWRLPFYSAAEKLLIGRALAHMLIAGRQGRDAVQDETFSHWLGDHQQPPLLLGRFWDTLCLSALNAPADRVGANYGLQTFQEIFLGRRDGHWLGVAECSLSELYGHARASAIFTNTRVEKLLMPSARLRGALLSNGQTLWADHIVLAVAPHAAATLLRPLPLATPLIAAIEQLRFAPIIGVHWLLDRPVMSRPQAALLDHPVQWLFRKDADGHHVHGVISGAEAYVDQPPEQLSMYFWNTILPLLPAARHARVLAHRLIKERRATFVPVPGVDRIRPDQQTKIPGLFLAGDYTNTGWPATMEGAARSGRLVAQRIIEAAGQQQ